MQAKTLHKIIHCAGRVSALLCKIFLLPAASESPYTSSHIYSRPYAGKDTLLITT